MRLTSFPSRDFFKSKMKEMMEMKVPKENNNIKKVKPKLLTKKGTKKNGKK